MAPDAPSDPHDVHRQYQALHAAMNDVARSMGDLEERVVRPTEGRIRDTSSLLQKAAALRIELEELNTRLTRLTRQMESLRDAMHPPSEHEDSSGDGGAHQGFSIVRVWALIRTEQ